MAGCPHRVISGELQPTRLCVATLAPRFPLLPDRVQQLGQLRAGDMREYDEVGTHILIDGQVGGQPRKLITHSARNGFLYTMERANGAMVVAKPYGGQLDQRHRPEKPASRSNMSGPSPGSRSWLVN